MNQNQLLIFSSFFFSYAVFLLISYKTDPRYSLKLSRKTSFYRIAGYSTINRIISLTLLLTLLLSAGQNLIKVFGFESLIPIQFWLPLGIIAGILIFFLGMPIKMLIQISWAKFGLERTRREEEILRMMFSKPLDFNEFLFSLSATTLINGIIEELIFRGLLLTNLNLAVPSIVAILFQAFLFFIPSLYQGIPNALLVFYKGIMLGTFLVMSNSIFVAITARLTTESIGLFIQAKSVRKLLKKTKKS